MNPFKTALFLAFALAPFVQYGQHTDEINSNRPGKSMSAFAVGKSVFQIESGIYGIEESHDLLGYDAKGLGVDMDIRYGYFDERLEFIANLQYQYENIVTRTVSSNKSALKQTVLGAKFLLYDPFKNYEKKINIFSWKANRRFDWHQLIPAVSVFGGANITFRSNPYHFSQDGSVSPKVMLITQNHLGDGRWVFVTNIIADYILTEYPSYGYVLTLTRGFNDKWSGFIENQGYKSNFYSDAIIRGGTAYLINKSMQVDASISTNFKTTPSILYGGIGFSWRYDANYKDVIINLDNNDSKKETKKGKKSKKEKTEEKAKKNDSFLSN
ncbi:transporter [Flavobacterium sp.]|uniref:transporter n=1 Tax=Flavobacterium sp. TaxID=239 RepID=UPI003C5A8944